jgi:hypothetical protein
MQQICIISNRKKGKIKKRRDKYRFCTSLTASVLSAKPRLAQECVVTLCEVQGSILCLVMLVSVATSLINNEKQQYCPIRMWQCLHWPPAHKVPIRTVFLICTSGHVHTDMHIQTYCLLRNTGSYCVSTVWFITSCRMLQISFVPLLLPTHDTLKFFPQVSGGASSRAYRSF